MRKLFTFLFCSILIMNYSFSQASGNVDLGSEITNGITTGGCTASCVGVVCSSSASGNHPTETINLTITGIPATNSVEITFTTIACGSTSGLDGGDDIFIDGVQVVDGSGNLMVNQTECVVGGADIVITFTVNRRDEAINVTWNSGVTDPGAGCFLAPTPVELASFSSVKNDDGVMLEWSTTTEIGNEMFIVEHSRNGVDYRSIGEVAGAGDSDFEQDYYFNHDAPAKGNNYYRLRQVDFSRAYTFSDVEVVSWESEGTLEIFPTQVQNIMTVVLDKDNNDKNILLHDFSGRLIRQWSTAATGNFELNMNGISTGTYLLTVQTDYSFQSAKVVKL